MSGLVLELQRDALNPSVSTLDILRKALVVARKLSLKDFEQWIKLELNGYPSSDVPDYRRVSAEVEGWHKINSRINSRAEMDYFKLIECFSTVCNGQPIGELIELVKNTESNLSVLLNPLGKTYSAHSAQYHISQLIDIADPKSHPSVLLRPRERTYSAHYIDEGKVHISVSTASIGNILQSVKTIILEWSLQLEEDGIIGEGMSFSDQEKQIAQKHTSEYNNCTFMNSSQQSNQSNSFNAPVGAFQNGNHNTSTVNQTIGSNNQEILREHLRLAMSINT
jgi:hypothetical protein